MSRIHRAAAIATGLLLTVVPVVASAPAADASLSPACRGRLVMTDTAFGATISVYKVSTTGYCFFASKKRTTSVQRATAVLKGQVLRTSFTRSVAYSATRTVSIPRGSCARYTIAISDRRGGGAAAAGRVCNLIL